MKVLLVDDEILVRTKIKYLLEVEIWQMTQGMQFVLCGEASNGAEALQKIEKINPDIVISDMKMPVMDGLELSRYIKEHRPDVCFLALSNYDDFEYVKGTLLNGASDYLLKHMLSAEYLLKALLKAAKDKKEKKVYPNLTEKNMDSLRTDFTMNLLTGLYRDQKMIERDMISLECPVSMYRVVPVIMWIYEYREGSLEEDTIQNFSILNIITEIMTEQKNGIVCRINDGKYAFILGYENIRSEQKMREELNFALNRIRFCMKKYLELSVYFMVGNIQESLLTINSEYKKLEESFGKVFYLEKDIWMGDFTEKNNLPLEKVEFSVQDEKAFVLALVNYDQEESYRILNAVLQKMNENRTQELVFRTVIIKLLAAIRRAAEECGISVEKIFEKGYSEDEIFGMKSFQNIQGALREMLNVFFNLREKHEMKTVSLYMQNALAYIYKHYTEPLSQAEVAEYVGISTVYLSVLFKNEVGEKFSSFLMNLRLDHAERLLKGGNVNLKEVAALSGFTDYVYFLKCFKKKNGMTPKEYIKNEK